MPNVLSLSLELLRTVSSYLDISDFAAFAISNHELFIQLLGNERYCKDVVAAFIPESREAHLARQGQITYQKAIVNTYFRRHALLSGTPYSITYLGRGTDFLLNNGVLCYLRGSLIHVLKIHATNAKEIVFNLDVILRAWTEKLGAEARVKLVHFQEEVLTISVSVNQNRKIMVLSTKIGIAPQRRILAALNMPYGREMVFRNNSKYLLIGRRENDLNGEREWQFWTHELVANASGQPSKPRWLCKIPSFESKNEIGTTLVLEIIDNHLWIMTSEITPDAEGLDPVSYYGGYCFALDGARSPKCWPKLWRFQRRRQKEGPIHDHWTSLSLKKNESSQYEIVESRKEWLADHPDDALRSFYTMTFEPCLLRSNTEDAYLQELQELQVDSTREELKESRAVKAIKDCLPDDEDEYVGTLLTVLPDDIFAPWPHSERYCHREYPSSSPMKSSSPPPPSTKVFSLNNTPYRTYDAPTNTFLEIVNDCQSGDSFPAASFDLRLRTGHKGAQITLWPQHSPPTPPLLRRLLQPRSLSSFRAISDEHCIVFGACTSRNAPIVLVSYDPSMIYGQKLENQKNEQFRPMEITYEAGPGADDIDDSTWGEYRITTNNDQFARGSPRTPTGAITYKASVDEYPALWTEGFVWWRKNPEILSRM